jgi:hypothetical protein
MAKLKKRPFTNHLAWVYLRMMSKFDSVGDSVPPFLTPNTRSQTSRFTQQPRLILSSSSILATANFSCRSQLIQNTAKNNHKNGIKMAYLTASLMLMIQVPAKRSESEQNFCGSSGLS